MDKYAIPYVELKENLRLRAGIYITPIGSYGYITHIRSYGYITHIRSYGYTLTLVLDYPNRFTLFITKDKLNFLIAESENLDSLIESIRLELILFGFVV
jgi:hypothetical protein